MRNAQGRVLESIMGCEELLGERGEMLAFRRQGDAAGRRAARKFAQDHGNIQMGIILNNTKDTHKSTYDAKRLRNYSLYNQTPKEKQRGVKDSRRRPQVQGLPLTIEPQLSTTLHILYVPYPFGDLYAL